MSATASSSRSLISPQYLPYLANACAVIACIPLYVGSTCLFAPEKALNDLEYPRASQKDQRLVEGMTILTGARTLATSLATFFLWRGTKTGDVQYKTLGGFILTFGVFLAADGYVVKTVVGKGGQWGHWAFIPVTTGLGLGLMGVI